MAITATENTTSSASEPPSGARTRSVRAWLFPSDQPGWARPGLFAVAALAALIFTWGAFHTAVNNFYAADARSMSMSWKNFLYGSFDPAGSVTIDKLWGFLWPQAISIKIFGYSSWALALPEAIEGVIGVLVLYRLVRRWTSRSDVALLAAGLFTLTPIVAATFGHSGLEDNTLTMCLILATDAFQKAMNTGRLRALALCGFWVGMAFQTKMVQAWTVVPVFGLIYLICAPHPLLKRIRHTLIFGAVTAVASLWLMIIVQLTPAADRPFIDGSNGTNNIFTMVFEYNFTSRFSAVTGTTSGGSFGGGSDWGKLFGASFGSQIGWLYPLALIALVFGLIKTRGTGRAGGERAGYLMWGGTLGITALAFSAGSIPHSQYMTVLAPGLAALGAAGIVGLARAFRDNEKLGWLLIVAIACTVGWATHLSYENTVFLTWLPPLVIALGLASILLLLAYRVRRIGKVLAVGVVLGTAAMVATPAAWALSTLDTSASYNGNNINAAAGPYSGQFGSAGRTGGMGGPGGSTSGSSQGGPGGGMGQMPGGTSSNSGSSGSSGQSGAPSGGFPGSSSGSSSSGSSSSGSSGAPSGGFPGSSSSSGSSGATSGAPSGGMGGGGGMPGGSGTTLSSSQQSLLTYLRAHQGSAKYLFAVMSSGDAEDYIANAGASVLPVGGFSGNNGYPSLAQFKALIASGELKYVLLSSSGSGGMGGGMGGTSSATSQIETWVKANCKTVSSSAYGGSSVGTLYVCSSS